MPRGLVLAVGLVLGGLGYLALVGYVWRYRVAAGGRGLLAILLAVFIWTTAYALEVSSRTVTAAEVWSTVKFVGVVGMPPGLLVYALEYTGNRPASRRLVALLSVVPVLTVASLLVPATRDLIHVYPPADRAAGTVDHVIVPATGPLFWPHAVYNYGLAFIALGLVVVRLFRAGHVYRRQALVVLAAALLPLLANIAYNAGLLGAEATDPVPFLFTVLAVVLVWGFFRLQLLDLVPVARDVVFEQMVDGVLVLDVHDRVVEVNPGAAQLLDVAPPALVGRYLAELLPDLGPVLARPLRPGTTDRCDLRLRRAAEGLTRASRIRPRAVRDLAVTVSTLVVGGRAAGRLVMLHDVTERQDTQRRLAELLDEQTRVADTLQAGLRPTTLPNVDGLEIAVRTLPAGVGGQVSGDFYDIHRVAGGDWAFVLGDVSGKGVEAAVLTSMARYTVRTLSAEGRAPRQVLQQLNRALLVDATSERFCTLAYARVDSTDLLALAGIDDLLGDPDTCVHVTLVLGGHPRPLLRRRSGDVQPVGVPGTAIGLLPRVEVEEVTLELESGDLLLAFTDGVTEARRGSEQFGEDRLADLLADAAVGLRGRTGVTAARLAAEAVAERVLSEITAWATRRDDVAVLVVAVP